MVIPKLDDEEAVEKFVNRSRASVQDQQSLISLQADLLGLLEMTNAVNYEGLLIHCDRHCRELQKRTRKEIRKEKALFNIASQSLPPLPPPLYSSVPASGNPSTNDPVPPPTSTTASDLGSNPSHCLTALPTQPTSDQATKGQGGCCDYLRPGDIERVPDERDLSNLSILHEQPPHNDTTTTTTTATKATTSSHSSFPLLKSLAIRPQDVEKKSSWFWGAALGPYGEHNNNLSSRVVGAFWGDKYKSYDKGDKGGEDAETVPEVLPPPRSPTHRTPRFLQRLATVRRATTTSPKAKSPKEQAMEEKVFMQEEKRLFTDLRKSQEALDKARKEEQALFKVLEDTVVSAIRIKAAATLTGKRWRKKESSTLTPLGKS